MKKYAFDVALIVALAPIILVVLAFCCALIALTDGRPVFYRSKRRIFRQNSVVIPKFRTMKRDAERIANRETVAIRSTRFLNISIDSELYTPAGRLIERFMLTELPQLAQVLSGTMSLVGNRPLPENVIASLKVENPDVEARFAVPCGLTGPVQLIGRDFISDADRLRLESYYCCLVVESYSILLDVKILLQTVLVGLSLRARFTVDEVVALLAREAGRQGAMREAEGVVGRTTVWLSSVFGLSNSRTLHHAGEFLLLAIERNRANLLSGGR